MKRNAHSLLLLILSLFVTVGMTLPVYGEGAPADENGGSSTITATTVAITQPEFSISIPATIEVGALTRAEVPSPTSVKETVFSVSVTDAADLGDKEIDVVISTPDGSFRLYSNGDNVIPYEVYNRTVEGDALRSGDLFHTFTGNGTATGVIVIDQYEIPAAGDYNGSLIFTVTVE